MLRRNEGFDESMEPFQMIRRGRRLPQFKKQITLEDIKSRNVILDKTSDTIRIFSLLLFLLGSGIITYECHEYITPATQWDTPSDCFKDEIKQDHIKIPKEEEKTSEINNT